MLSVLSLSLVFSSISPHLASAQEKAAVNNDSEEQPFELEEEGLEEVELQEPKEDGVYDPVVFESEGTTYEMITQETDTHVINRIPTDQGYQEFVWEKNSTHISVTSDHLTKQEITKLEGSKWTRKTNSW